MATTTDLVQKITMTASNATACVFIGPTPTNTELFILQLKTADSSAQRAFKRSMITLLSKAQKAGYKVTVTHPENSAEITQVSFGGFDICPIGSAIHNDFYSISGSGFPDDARVVFESAGSVVTVTPDFVRPQWLFISELSPAVPVGRNNVRVTGTGYGSDAVPIDVSGGTPVTTRVLYSGAPKDEPYTFIFVANPAIETEAGTFITDPVLTDRTGFHDVVGFCLQNLFLVTENLLKQNGLDRHMRFVTIFDNTVAANGDNALAHELSPNLMETRRNRLNTFVGRYSEKADMVFVIHGSTTHDRATAWFTTDDNSKAGTAFIYDGVNRTHRHFPSIPGSCAVPLNMNQTGLTPLHEFGHAGSDFNNGRVADLYHDGAPGGFTVNKKIRANSTDPIPVNFATYDGTTYRSDQGRDNIGYPNTWRTYHPELIDQTRPNLMDNYWLAANPQNCRLDRLTYEWFSDRLRAKIFR
jgi:hypothetical protein